MDFLNARIVDPAPDQNIGRTVTNAFGHSELIVMEWRCWQYLDWMARDYKARPIEEWIRECDLTRGDKPLADALKEWIYLEFQAREREGKPRPPYLPQQGQILDDHELFDDGE